MSSVSLKNVNKVFGKDVFAVKDFNLEIKPEEFIVLVGPSGCGKSTTLRMIAGLEEPTSGEIFIDDVIVNDLPPKDRDIAMVFQNYALYPHMNVRDNMAFGLKLRKHTKDEIKNRVNEAAKILSLDELLDRKPKELSGGQRQRVALGRAIVRNAKVFLFDEPLSNLDAKLRVLMRSEISRIHNQMKYTMIYVTHDQTEAMTMGTRIVVMKDGVVHQVDTPLNLYNHPVNKFVGGFIGSPSMNFFNAVISVENNISVKCTGDMDQSFTMGLTDKLDHLKKHNGKEIIIGIRPEDVTIDNSPEPNEQRFSGLVEVVEPMGNETFIHLNAGLDEPFLVRSAAEEIPKVGEKVTLILNEAKVQFFDKSSEMNLFI